MSAEYAAKMLIVGWVKNWSIRTVLNAIREKDSNKISDEEISDFHKQYPFMPQNIWLYLSHGGAGTPVRKFMYDNYRKVNDALWDTDDNKIRLSFAKYLASKKCPNIKPSSAYTKKDKVEHQKAIKAYNNNVISMTHYKEIMHKSSGHDWFTVK
jgi:hypothetical protein